MNGGLSQMARVSADVADTGPVARPKWLNLSPAEAMNLPASDPVADEMFARSRAYGSMLERSLERTDAMLAPCQCGMATVFCACEGISK